MSKFFSLSRHSRDILLEIFCSIKKDRGRIYVLIIKKRIEFHIYISFEIKMKWNKNIVERILERRCLKVVDC